jgi:hypothetical protein
MEQEGEMPLSLGGGGNVHCWIQGPMTSSEQPSDLIVRNLIEALNRLHDDLDRVELWTAALRCFQEPTPDYRPGGDHLLPILPILPSGDQTSAGRR